MFTHRTTAMAGNEPEHLPARQTLAPLSDLAVERALLCDILIRAGSRDRVAWTKARNLPLEDRVEMRVAAAQSSLAARSRCTT